MTDVCTKVRNDANPEPAVIAAFDRNRLHIGWILAALTAVILGASLPSAVPAAPTPGLVAAYAFNEGSGTRQKARAHSCER